MTKVYWTEFVIAGIRYRESEYGDRQQMTVYGWESVDSIPTVI